MTVGSEFPSSASSELRALIPPGATIVDADVHAVVPSIDVLVPFVDEHWREHIARTAFQGAVVDTAYPPGAPTSARPGARPLAERSVPSLELVQREALAPFGSSYGILNCLYGMDTIRNPDTAAAIAQAINDWLIAEWLDKDPRLRASIVVPGTRPDFAAREIERVGGHPGFVQVLLPARSPAPYGGRQYHPIFEAATRHDLAIGIHFGGTPGNPPTGVGWPSYYIEEYVGMAHVFQTQIMSLVVEGVFDRFETARVALVESGFAWLPAFLWRFDKDWKGLRREMPWNKRTPSEYVREHIKLTLQPFDAPETPEALAQVLEHLGSDDMLMFSSDYPHWHYDDDRDAIPRGIAPDAARKILGGTALDFYRLEATT